jgi:CheY-like chemotaxis protein
MPSLVSGYMVKPNSDYRILVVDDTPSLLKLANTILGRRCGYGIVTADSGNAAWEYLTSKGLTPDGKVDLVFTDHDMPNGNGSELVQMIREDDRFKDLPIIMVSGEHDNRDTPGIDHFIARPYNMHHLIETVQQYLPKEL